MKHKCLLSCRLKWEQGSNHRLSGHEFEQTLGDAEGQGSLACCSPWGCQESNVTEPQQQQRANVCDGGGVIPKVSGDNEALECNFPSCTGWQEGNCVRTEMCGSLNTLCNLPGQALCSQARKSGLGCVQLVLGAAYSQVGGRESHTMGLTSSQEITSLTARDLMHHPRCNIPSWPKAWSQRTPLCLTKGTLAFFRTGDTLVTVQPRENPGPLWPPCP